MTGDYQMMANAILDQQCFCWHQCRRGPPPRFALSDDEVDALDEARAEGMLASIPSAWNDPDTAFVDTP